jgi:FkbM family methyltransferase
MHPYGYWLGTQIVRRFDFLLPHEADFWGFRLLAGSRPGTFLDLGANMGHSARGFNRVVPGWKILSVEANPMHQPALEAVRQRLAGFNYRIAAIDARSRPACSLHVPYFGRLAMHSSAAASLDEAVAGIALSFPRQAAQITYREVSTPVVSVDDLDIAPALVKVDIQGNELAMLAGAMRTIERHRPEFLVEVVMNPSPIVSAFAEIDYRAFAFDAVRGAFSAYDADSPLASRNLFFSPRNLVALSPAA